MPGSLPLPPDAAHKAKRLMRRLSTLWRCPELARVRTVAHSSPRNTLGRFSRSAAQISLAPAALARTTFREALIHEAAHAALALSGKANNTRPHGPEWQHLMALAGFPKAKATSQRPCMPRNKANRPKARYDHHCPVCQTSRTAKRPVPEWRCAACVTAGLPGRLEIQRAMARA